MNQRQLDLLRALAHSPRTLRSFTNGFLSVHPSVVVRDLDSLEEGGYLEQSAREVYSITRVGEMHLQNQREITPPKTWGPMSTTGSYQPPKWSVRVGAEQFLQCASVGVRT